VVRLDGTTPVKEFNEKKSDALRLGYTLRPGFAHYKSQAACNELI